MKVLLFIAQFHSIFLNPVYIKAIPKINKTLTKMVMLKKDLQGKAFFLPIFFPQFPTNVEVACLISLILSEKEYMLNCGQWKHIEQYARCFKHERIKVLEPSLFAYAFLSFKVLKGGVIPWEHSGTYIRKIVRLTCILL